MLTRRPVLGEDRGAAAVEFAILFVLFVAIVLGTVTAGAAWNQKVNMTNTAREATRYGATLSFSAAGGSPANLAPWYEAVMDYAQTSAGGDLDPGVDDRVICVAYNAGSGGWRRGAVRGSGTVPGGNGSNQPCFAESPSLTGPRVQVYVGRAASISFVLGSVDTNVGGRSVTRYEAVTS